LSEIKRDLNNFRADLDLVIDRIERKSSLQNYEADGIRPAYLNGIRVWDFRA